jgi:hypothetical protein
MAQLSLAADGPYPRILCRRGLLCGPRLKLALGVEMKRTEPSAKQEESRQIIEQFHFCLNRKRSLPEMAYRRNASSYPLVCYINNIVGLFLSENYAAIPIFVARASEHMEQFPPSLASTSYYALATSYLSHMVWHLKSFCEGVEIETERTSPTILNSGRQERPVCPE